MKTLILGDPHGKLPKNIKQIVKQNQIELILITGDIPKCDLARKQAFEEIKREKQGLSEKIYTPKEIQKAWLEIYNSAIEILKKLSKLAPIYFIMGNVSKEDKETKEEERELGIKLPLLFANIKKIPNTFYLKDETKKFKNIKIGALEHFHDNSWIKEFKEKDQESILNAKIETLNAKKTLQKFKKIDVLLCHAPPFGILDKVSAPYAPKHWQGKHAGSKAILDYIKKKQPRYVFCGHIHEAKGKAQIGKTTIYNVGHAGDYLILNIN